MALQSTFNDQFGNSYQTAYGVVDDCNGNKHRKTQHFVFEIYKDRESRLDGKQPVASYSYDISGSDFDTWFSVTAIDNDDNQYARAYSYLKQLENSEGTLVWDGWVDV